MPFSLDPGHPIYLFSLLDIEPVINPLFSLSFGFIIEVLILILLLFISGFVSGAETAFFSITPAQLNELKVSENTTQRMVYGLLEKPKRLLATLLIAINFVNIAIIVLSTLLINQVFVFQNHEVIGFLIQVVALTFVIVLFCEVMPKVYATQNAMRIARRSVLPVYGLDKVLRPFSTLLVLSTSVVDKRINQKGYDVSVDELTHAIDITSDKNTPEDEKKILKGIARFGNIDVKQIMKPRMDVVAFDKEMKFPELFPLIIENKYSRVPVYEGSLDTVIGVLYIKDLLPFLDDQSKQNFDWLKLLRPAYFVPESKKINDLLQEFQEKKIHLAVVVDEYGGSSGIVTLEDILEEIVGEIHDEFDEDELFYSRLDDQNFVFEGKTLLNDLCRVMEIDRKLFDVENDNIDTLAGFLLELKGGIPQRGEVIVHESMTFTIESADRKRIKRVKVSVPASNSENKNSGQGFSAFLIWILLFVTVGISSCSDDYIPKPRGYFRIALPEKTYHSYDPVSCPFSFDIPDYARVVMDSSRNAEPCWMNLEFPQFKGTVYLSYKSLNGNLQQCIEDCRSLSMKHISKASGIEELDINRPAERVFGLFYSVKGNAASSLQFYVTDSVRHFLRGSLYFYTIPNTDSIAPVQQFLEKDVRYFVESFRWK